MLKDKSMFGVAQVFEEAGNIMRQRGICKGEFEDEKGRVCFAGAVRLAENGKQEFSDALWMSDQFFVAENEWGGIGATCLNDRTETTTEDMAAWLDAMASLYLSEAVANGELD